MLPHTSGILTAVLPCLAYEDEERRMVSFISLSFLTYTQEPASLGWAGWAVWMANHYEKTDEGDIAKVVVTKNERTTLSSFLAKVMAKPLLLCSSSKSDSLCLVLPCFKDGIANIQGPSEKFALFRFERCLGRWMPRRWSWWRGRRGTSWNCRAWWRCFLLFLLSTKVQCSVWYILSGANQAAAVWYCSVKSCRPSLDFSSLHPGI